MPEYQYRCTKCNTRFSIVKPMLLITDIICPECKTGENVKRTYTPIGVLYKSDGFYKTDSRKRLTDNE